MTNTGHSNLCSNSTDCYVPSRHPEVIKVLDKIKETHGIAVMTHPRQFNFLCLLEMLAQHGLIQGGIQPSQKREGVKSEKISHI